MRCKSESNSDPLSAVARGQQHKFSEAKSSLKRYLASVTDPKDIKAVKHWRKAIEMYPDHPQADKVYSGLGDVYMRQGDLDAAYKYMQRLS